jgi:hypothetical protein
MGPKERKTGKGFTFSAIGTENNHGSSVNDFGFLKWGPGHACWASWRGSLPKARSVPLKTARMQHRIGS